MYFHFDAKKNLIRLCVLFSLIVIFGIINIVISFIKQDSFLLKQGIVSFELALVCLLVLIYGYGYSVDINGNELIIRLCYFRKKYNLFDLTKYTFRENKHYATFKLYFINKKRTITITKKDELIQILNQYVKEPQ